ncbi:unnamed protein product [Echinostoma caproni]|uniref:RGS domain-containing protein n=1 Tax=Echinostoma caproni TaxID=27848 RepID=A0A183B7V7_9TREM|nr:unnamed protein product [Echinostoma caproni]
MSYPPDTSRSCHEADGRSDRSGGSGGATSSSGGGVYGTLCSNLGGKWPIPVSTALSTTATTTPSGELIHDPSHHTSLSHDRLVSNWKKWSLGLDYLLQDSEGVALFKTYLQYEGCSNLLDFWFACQGFRSKVDPSDHRKIAQLIKVIYRTYIRGSGSGTVGMTNVSLSGQLAESQTNPNVLQSRTEPIRLRTETKRMISERISRKHSLDQSVFDPAQTEVEHFLRTTAYPAFLKSDVYVDFLQSTIDGSTHKFVSIQDPSARSVPVGGSGMGCPNVATATFSGNVVSHPLGGKFLPTLEEDRELRSDELPCYSVQQGRAHPAPSNLNVAAASVTCAVSHSQPQLHCLHCSQYHSQGHPMCPPNDRANPWLAQMPHPAQPGLRPFGSANNPIGLLATTSIATTGTGAAAPLTTENLQMTRFYRAELSMQQQAFITPSAGSSNMIRMMHHQPVDLLSRRPYPQGTCDLTTGSPRPLASYGHTHWADALCSSRLPSQPPNPYHISYAPVSARDSERHSLSSEARTDDTHSHTDSSQPNEPSNVQVAKSNPVTELQPADNQKDAPSKSASGSGSGFGCGSGSSPSSAELEHGRASEAAELNALLSLSFPSDRATSGPAPPIASTLAPQSLGDTSSHTPLQAAAAAGVACATSTTATAVTTVSTTQHSTSSSITSAISTSTPGLPASSPSSNSSPNTLVIGYYLGDDPVPYRSLWPASEITLGQFKQLIPKKKGSFR